MNRRSSEFSHRQPMLSEVIPADEEAILREHIALFTEKHALHPRLAEALWPDNALMYATGLPRLDKRLMRKYVTDVGLALQHFNEDHELSFASDVPPIDYNCDDEAGRLRRNVFQQGMHDMGIHENNFLATLKASALLTIYQSGILGFIIESTRTSTYHLYQQPLGFSDNSVTLEPEDAAFIGAVSGKIGDVELSSTLEKNGFSNLSKEALNARFAHFTAVAQFEIVRFALHDWLEFRRATGLGKARSADIQHMLESIALDNLPAKINNFGSLGFVIEGAPSNNVTDEVKTLMARRTKRFAETIQGGLTIFQCIYKRKGFELPYASLGSAVQELSPSFSPDFSQGSEQGRQQLVLAQQLRAEERARARQEFDEQRAILLERQAILTEQASRAKASWTLTKTQRTKLGLADVYKSLRQGFEIANGETVVIQIPDEEVVPTIGILVRLDELSRASMRETDSIIGAQAELEVALKLHEALEYQRDELYKDARALKVTDLSPVDLTPLQIGIDRIKAQWPAFEKLIREKWPNQGSSIALRIKELLALP